MHSPYIAMPATTKNRPYFICDLLLERKKNRSTNAFILLHLLEFHTINGVYGVWYPDHIEINAFTLSFLVFFFFFLSSFQNMHSFVRSLIQILQLVIFITALKNY